ncbi:hypothetical protein GOV05_03695 [Candidatus Woesearchaeota archaeon]|nr:hypothetical protein [Candidatus Woesearchaeota archaeon]
MSSQSFGGKIIKTDDGWMTFLILTLVLLSTSFFTLNYLKIQAESYLVPLQEELIDGDDSGFGVFDIRDDDDKPREETSSGGYVEAPKDLKTLLEEKKRAESVKRDEDTRPSLDDYETSFETEEVSDGGVPMSTAAVVKDAFFVVNHAFTYDNVFNPEEAYDTTFSEGTTIYLFVEMYNLQEDLNGDIDLAIDFLLKNEDNRVIPGYDAQDLVVYKGKPPYKDGYFLARMRIPLGLDFNPGKYYTDLVIRDKVSGKIRKEKYLFRIRQETI